MNKVVQIVDDEVSWISSHREIIETVFPNMFELRFSTSAEDALRSIKESQPDLLITDLVMEDMKDKSYAGEFLVKNVKKLYPAIKVIIISGSSDVAKVASRNKADGYIPKWSLLNYPIRLKLLIKEIFQINTENC